MNSRENLSQQETAVLFLTFPMTIWDVPSLEVDANELQLSVLVAANRLLHGVAVGDNVMKYLIEMGEGIQTRMRFGTPVSPPATTVSAVWPSLSRLLWFCTSSVRGRPGEVRWNEMPWVIWGFWVCNIAFKPLLVLLSCLFGAVLLFFCFREPFYKIIISALWDDFLPLPNNGHDSRGIGGTVRKEILKIHFVQREKRTHLSTIFCTMFSTILVIFWGEMTAFSTEHHGTVDTGQALAAFATRNCTETILYVMGGFFHVEIPKQDNFPCNFQRFELYL